MSMSVGDFETVASVLAESSALNHLSPSDLRDHVLDFANVFCATNDRFDPVRFANTCGAGLFTEQDVMEYSHALSLRVPALSARRKAIRERG